jgi:hypothetical protein
MEGQLIFLMGQVIDGFLAARIFDRAQEGSLIYWISIGVTISISMMVAERLTR